MHSEKIRNMLKGYSNQATELYKGYAFVHVFSLFLLISDLNLVNAYLKA